MILKLMLAAIISTSGNLYDSMQDRMLYIKADKVKIIYHQYKKDLPINERINK